MSFDYSEMAAVADELLTEFGATATMTRNTAGTYDTSDGTTAAPTTTVQTVTAAVFDYEQKYLDGTLILAGDKQAFLSPAGITAPLQGDVLTWQGTDYTVIAVKPLSPAGVPLLFELQVRSA
jgi:hypothetical protein